MVFFLFPSHFISCSFSFFLLNLFFLIRLFFQAILIPASENHFIREENVYNTVCPRSIDTFYIVHKKCNCFMDIEYVFIRCWITRPITAFTLSSRWETRNLTRTACRAGKINTVCPSSLAPFYIAEKF